MTDQGTPDLGLYLYSCTDHGWRRPSFARACPKCGDEMERVQVTPVAERDRLRAENERLREAVDVAHTQIAAGLDPETEGHLGLFLSAESILRSVLESPLAVDDQEQTK